MNGDGAIGEPVKLEGIGGVDGVLVDCNGADGMSGGVSGVVDSTGCTAG